jgi:mycothiol synthase
MTATLPQLRMGFTRFDELEPPQVSPPYSLRTYRPGDEEAWLAMLNTGSFGAWDQARLDEFLHHEGTQVPRDNIFFATLDDVPVGSTCLVLHSQNDGAMVPEVGWVIVHPDHRGHGLARETCRAVLGVIKNLGYRYAYLKTEDFRIPAIKTYLRLGFVPEMVDPAHPAWWAETQRALMSDDDTA